MIRYKILSERSSQEPLFSTFNTIMWSKTDDDLCVGLKEHRLRELLTWLNDRGTMYHIEINITIPDLSKSGFFATLGHQIDYDQYKPIHHFVLHVDDETAVLMKLFFEEFEPVEEAVTVSVDAAADSAVSVTKSYVDSQGTVTIAIGNHEDKKTYFERIKALVASGLKQVLY